MSNPTTLILPRRKALLALPAIILARSTGEAEAQIPQPMSCPVAPGLLDTLSSTTTIVGAWSTTRRLKSGVVGPFFSGVLSGLLQLIPFTCGGIVDTSHLTAANMALTGGPGGLTGRSWVDQSGNGNYLGQTFEGFICPVTTPSATLNAPLTVAGGYVVPGISLGYNGLSAGLHGPSVNTVNNAGGVMSVSFGAATQFFMITVYRPVSGKGDPQGIAGAFTHTGDSNSFSAPTSAVFLNLNGSNTSGAVRATRNSTSLSSGIGPVGNITMQGSIFDGTNNTLYIDRAAQPPIASTGPLGAGGNYGIGDDAVPGTFGTRPLGADMWEHIIGTFSNPVSAFVAGDWALIQNNMRAFYGTP